MRTHVRARSESHIDLPNDRLYAREIGGFIYLNNTRLCVVSWVGGL